MVKMGLEKGVGVGVHVGESKGEVEKRDIEVILGVLEGWDNSSSFSSSSSSSSSTTYFHGKIRLGHGIYLTEQQKKRVFSLSLPVEVCPTCHLRINWHTPPSPHPISLLYPSLDCPLVVGTDDCLVFGAGCMEEWGKMKRIFGNPKVFFFFFLFSFSFRFYFCFWF